MNLLIVATYTKTNVSVLRQTLTSLLAEGADTWDDRVVLCDGRAPRLPSTPGWRIESKGAARRGALHAPWDAIRYAGERDVERLLYCEDDVQPCKNAVRWARAVPIASEVGFVNLCDTVRDAAWKDAPVGLHRHRLPGSQFVHGTQALLLARPVLVWLCAQPFDGGQHPCGCSVLQKMLCESPWPACDIAIPSLFDHVSFARESYIRMAARQFDAQFDALALPLASGVAT